MKKRLLSALLVFVMLLSLLPVQALAVDPANPFRDVNPGDWCYDAVQYVRVNGLFNGTSRTTFSPNDTMTRGMFVTVLGRLVGVDTARYQGPSAFTDVPEDAYFAPYVAWASTHGVTTGTGDGVFSPYAQINRQQMAAFFVRYFDAFGVDYDTGANITTTPADIGTVAPYARDAVLKLWRQGLLNGDGVNFNPENRATRAQAAMVCYRMDQAVETWYKEPGVPSERVKAELPATEPSEPAVTEPPGGGGTPVVESPGSTRRRYVSFYDGQRLIETIPGTWSQPLGRVPSVEKSSKAGAVLAGYYTDESFTTPFYADDPVYGSINVYAKYEPLADPEETLNLTVFTRMDQSPHLTFQIRRVSGGVEPQDAAWLSVKDGSEAVALTITPNRPSEPEIPEDPEEPADPVEPGDPDTLVCTVAADPRFNEGCSYELTLAEGWVFVDEATGEDRPETIRTASFSIAMEEVHALRMNENVRFLEDTNLPGGGDLTFEINGTHYDTLTNSAVTDMGTNGAGFFQLPAGYGLSPGDILCVYVGTRPDERRTGGETRDPAAYVKVQDISGDTVTFQALGAEDQKNLYEIPDNFPFRVDALPAAGGTISIDALDTELYAIMAGMSGREDETPDLAASRLNRGDFVTFHTGEITSGGLFFGEITDVSGGLITYIPVTREDILHSMDLYDQVETTGSDLLAEEDRAELEARLEEAAAESGFAEEAAYLLADLVTKTNGFQESAAVQEYLLTGADGLPLPQEQVSLLAGNFSLVNAPKLRVQLRTRGDHFGGVQVKLTVSARFRVPLGSDAEAFLGDYIAIDLEGSFTEELSFVPTVKGYMLYTEILGFIPVPNGVHVNANLDVKNYTAFSFDANIYSTDLNGVVEGEIEHVSSQLEALMKTASEEEYQKSLTALLARYEELVSRDAGWITLVEEKMFSTESCFYGICYGTQGTFVVRADVNLAIGSSMEYEVGKRFTFWFEVGLFSPTAGSDSMDLLDERFAFQFYVMGRLSVRMGVRLKIYVGIGTGDFASVGLTTEIGPYLKLYGFFFYTYNRYRPQGSSLSSVKEQKGGAIGLELGLYFTLGVEATALKIFTYSKDFIDQEFPLYHAGSQEAYYDCAYRPEPDEAVYVSSESSDPSDVVMTVPEPLLELDYIALKDGRRGSRALPLDQYFFSVSNSNFSLEQTGGKLKVRVNVPENVHLLRCTLTVTYRGKLPLSNYDMTTTIPLVWTDLSVRQMKEYFTASVRVGNDLDGYDTVWRQKVLRGEEFDLPTDGEVRNLAHWNDYRYEPGTGYGGRGTTSLGISEDTVYDYNVKVREYSVTVTGIQGGKAASQTYTAKFGEAFDFSDLERTGKRGPREFTKFSGLEADLYTTLGTDQETGQPVMEALDITQPIQQRLAEALDRGNTRVRAAYADDSVTAVYSFFGIDHEDVTSTTGRGMEPRMDVVYGALEEAAEAMNLENLEITGITPEHGPISAAQHYTVQCLSLSGRRAFVSFDPNGGEPVDPIDKLAGSVLANLPEPARTGYTFQGWTNENGEPVTSVVVPEEGTTLTAQWSANTYTLTLNGNGGEVNGQSSVDKDLVYDGAYGDLPEPTRSGYRFFGWWTEPGFEPNGPGLEDDAHDGTQVTADTPVDHAEDRTVYAHWKPLMDLGGNSGGGSLFEASVRREIYDRNTDYTVDDLTSYYSQIPGLYDEEGNPIPTSGFQFELKPKIAGGPATGTAKDAASYILEITRNADETYYSYTETHDILVIDKADWVEAIWNTGNFPLEIEGHDGGITNWVTVRYPAMDGDLPSGMVSGMKFRMWRESNTAFFPEKNETHDFGGHFEDNGSGSRVEIYLKFPDGASSKNYNLPSEVLIYNGGIRSLLDKDPNRITTVP